MIAFEGVSKEVIEGGRRRHVLVSVDVEVPTNRCVALLGRSEEDRRLIISCMAGSVMPSEGRVTRDVRVSFPVGTVAGFQAELSVRLNVMHIARLYDADVAAVTHFVEHVANIGYAFDRPYGELNKSQRIQFAQVFGFAIPFDVYLLMADTERMSRPVRAVVDALFRERGRTAGMIISTRNLPFAREHCDMALLHHDGGLYMFDDVNDAIRAMERAQGQAAFANLHA